MDLDYEQAKLIYDSEIAHFCGLRSSSVSGSYNEDLLIKILQASLPNFKFGKGNIIAKNEVVDEDGFIQTKKRGKGTSRPQTDIIIYTGEPLFTKHDYCVVRESDVITALEIKKWLQPKVFEDYIIGDSSDRWKRFYPSISRLLIGFRIWESDKFSLEKVCQHDSFVFSKSFQNEAWANRGKEYHMIDILNKLAKKQDERVEIIKNEIVRPGELRRLIDRIEEMRKG